MDAVTVRAARPEDLPAVAALRWSWVADEQGDPDVVPRDAFVTELVRWAHEHRDSHRCLVAERDGELVGMAWLAITARVPSPRSLDRRTCDLQSVYVLPAHRSDGVGHALVEAAAAEAAALGAERIVVHSSERAVSLYDRAGFSSSPLLRDRRPAG